MARLDRLGAAKQVAQVGAAIGREFSHALLSAVVSKPEPEVASALDRLAFTALTYMWCGNYLKANEQIDELIALAGEKRSVNFKAAGRCFEGAILAFAGRNNEAIPIITTAITEWRATQAKLLIPTWLSYLARAHAELGQLDDAWQNIRDALTAIKATRETWCAAEVHRISGEIALKESEPDLLKAQMYFERALAIAREQQAKKCSFASASGFSSWS
jgi:tetratricopeptide (TPR) repeat protein